MRYTDRWGPAERQRMRGGMWCAGRTRPPQWALATWPCAPRRDSLHGVPGAACHSRVEPGLSDAMSTVGSQRPQAVSVAGVGAGRPRLSQPPACRQPRAALRQGLALLPLRHLPAGCSSGRPAGPSGERPRHLAKGPRPRLPRRVPAPGERTLLRAPRRRAGAGRPNPTRGRSVPPHAAALTRETRAAPRSRENSRDPAADTGSDSGCGTAEAPGTGRRVAPDGRGPPAPPLPPRWARGSPHAGHGSGARATSRRWSSPCPPDPTTDPERLEGSKGHLREVQPSTGHAAALSEPDTLFLKFELKNNVQEPPGWA